MDDRRKRDPRNRQTERINLELLKLESRRAAQPLLVILVGLIFAVLAGGYILHNISGGVGATHQMKFEVADATGVVPQRAEVRFYGIGAGQVSDVKLEQGHAIITAEVAKKFGPVYKDARAEVRPNTALQDMYLDITDAGTPEAGTAGPTFVVPIGQTTSPVNLAEVLNTFQPPVRKQLYTLLDQFGNGMEGRGDDLRRAFALLAPFLRIAGQTADQLAVRSDLTKQLVHNASELSQTLASRSNSLTELVESGSRTLEAVGTQNGRPLNAALHQLWQTLTEAHHVIGSGLRLEDQLDVVLDRLPPVVDALPGGLDNLRALANAADPAVTRLQAPVRQLVPLSGALRPFSSNLASALTRIRPLVPALDKLTSDAVKCEDQFNEFWNWDKSMSKFSDDQGPMVRGNINFGIYTLPNFDQGNYGYGKQCAGGAPIAGVPVPRYDGPAATIR
ncbi:MAG: phospholipid/cholesterol/gamma-HCH transport system substrate-binding protein [Solirubrobacteraceae bacterium]|jgi:ABC-type transporter Mla subunit MlaD|nr:phospholipid/cholesterol/gamma-HCH transport system substrate-binding protein [Solirubrobacteraceae bacterium]